MNNAASIWLVIYLEGLVKSKTAAIALVRLPSSTLSGF